MRVNAQKMTVGGEGVDPYYCLPVNDCFSRLISANILCLFLSFVVCFVCADLGFVRLSFSCYVLVLSSFFI